MSLIPATADAWLIQNLFNIAMILATIVFAIVMGLLLITAFRDRRRRDDEMPVQMHGSTKAELSWTIVPFLVVSGLFFFSSDTLAKLTARGTATSPVAHVHGINDELARKKVEEAKKTDLVVRVTGRQWYWQFQYAQWLTNTVSVNTVSHTDQVNKPEGEQLLLPAGKTIRFDMTAADVIHAFWVPQLSGMVYVNPGEISYVWFTAPTAGEYYGQCNYICGLNHAQMISRVKVVPEAEFAAWLNQKRAEQVNPVAASGDPQSGAKVYAEGAYVHAGAIAAAKGDVAQATAATGLAPQQVANVMAYLESLR